jgi:predicted ATPase/class 3 adenylate cyclase
VPGSSTTVTFLFTDIEGSTRLWQQGEDAMRVALARHDELLAAVIAKHDGTVFSTMGDGLAAVFGSASSALAAAIEGQRALAGEAWPTPVPVRVRMGLHTGEAEVRDGDYFGTAVNRAARLMAIGHGGQVLCSSVTAGLVGDSVVLVDLGEHRLRDLDRPMRVFEAGPGGFPPLRSLDVMPGNLRSLSSSFVGRQVERAAVAKAVGAARLVTVTGVGGVGKTRLGLQIAADLSTGFADGVWLCELAAATSGDELVQVVAIALGVVQRAQMSLADSIVDFLRPRRLLVVLDNCEHLLDAAAELVQNVLAAAPGVRILATSREGLAVEGEHLWPLPSLGLPADLNQAAASESVVLFAERATAVNPRFVLDDDCMPAVVEVCRRLDGIPLAIELAAARVASMSPAEIAGHLDERFRLLTGGRRGQVERHQTLRATVEWSYSLLDLTERVVFDRLGVFPASFDEAAAVAVCASGDVQRWDVIDALASLVAKSMVGVDRSGDTTRYQLLETLRHYARDRAGGALEGLRRRHGAHFAEVAERVGAGLMSADELAWRPRLAVELDNLRAAAGWAFDAATADDVAIGVRVIDGLLMEVVNQRSWGIQAWAAAAFGRIEQLDAEQRSVVLTVAALDAFYLGRFDQAQVLGGRVIGDADDFNLTVLQAMAAVGLSTVAAGDPTTAAAIVAEIRRRLQRCESTNYLACACHIGMCAIAFYIDDGPTARSDADQAVAYARQIRSPTLLAQALAGRAQAYTDLEPGKALAAAEESVQLIEAGAGSTPYAWVLLTAAVLHSARGDTASAAKAIRAATTHEARTGGSRTILVTLVALAAQVLARHADRLDAAAILSGAVTGPVFGHVQMLQRTAQLGFDLAMSDVASALGAQAYDNDQQRGATMSFDDIISFTIDRLTSFVEFNPRNDWPSR